MLILIAERGGEREATQQGETCTAADLGLSWPLRSSKFGCMRSAVCPLSVAFAALAQFLLPVDAVGHVLTYSVPAGGKYVEIRGSFDGWQKGYELKLSNQNAIVAEIDVTSLGLAPGRYEYKFLIDGKFEEGANRILLIESQRSAVEPTPSPPAASTDWRKPMEEARGKNDWAKMVEICQRAADQGITDEYLLRSLSWAHRNLKQTAESWEVAQRNLQINPCTFSRIEYIDSARDHGMYEEAVKVAVDLKNDSGSWGELARESERAIASVSSHTYEIRWKIPPARAAKEKRAIAIPQQDPWVQKSVEVNVEGLRRWSFETSDDGIKYVEAVLTPRDTDVWVTAKVTLSPHSWKTHLHKVTDEPLPPQMRWYLRKGEFEGNPEAIDPTGPLAKQLAAELKGASNIETVENVLRYIAENVPWQHSPENAGPSSEACLQVKKGSCTPRTFAATAILRAAGIPARAVRGFSLSTKLGPNTNPPLSHTLLQFYLPGLGWLDAEFRPPFWTPRTDYLRMSIRAGKDPYVPRQPREGDGFFKFVGASL